MPLRIFRSTHRVTLIIGKFCSPPCFVLYELCFLTLLHGYFILLYQKMFLYNCLFLRYYIFTIVNKFFDNFLLITCSH